MITCRLTLLTGPHWVVSAAEIEVSILLSHTPHLLLDLSPQPHPQTVIGVRVGSGGDVDRVMGHLHHVEVNLQGPGRRK